MPEQLSRLSSSSGNNLNAVLRRLATEKIGNCCFSEPLSRHSSWKIGGPADLFVEPETVEQVIALKRLVRDYALPLVVIGEGSNLLFCDAGVRGVVMKIGHKMAQIEISGDIIRAQAGVWVPGLARKAMQAGLGGLEHCIGIPGTLGGLVLMNGGSQRRGIGENIQQVTLIDRNGRQRNLSQEECAFGYRHSALQGNDSVVVGAELRCPRKARSLIRGEMLADLRERRRKFPRKLPNCGSVFLSTAAMHQTVGPPGKIIEAVGLKGASMGQAEVSSLHANFIINRGGAKAVDVLRLIQYIRTQVQSQVGFTLACEVRFVDSHGKIAPAHLYSENVDELKSSSS
ncbi:MAG: UDP-N-acetylmuramate dehydrogenase [Desulfuromonadales bacterium]|nr:UDP-N-acetylmuramate dehydrogenase [Desulfuromonadales bacterium]MBN2791260.1 UDP-N-acetylmuramate dehydrogenase [Desulfuromonadales bacterium]